MIAMAIPSSRSAVTEETLRTHKEFILRLYNIEVDKLYNLAQPVHSAG